MALSIFWSALNSANPETLVGDEHDHRDDAGRSSDQGNHRQGMRAVWLEPMLLNADDLPLAVLVLAVRAGARRHLRAAADHRRMPKLAGQRLWLVAPVGSRFGMYPATEIDMHLDCICAAHRQAPGRPRVRVSGPRHTAPTCSPFLVPGEERRRRRSDRRRGG
jgi:hypothetical protein